LLDPDTRALLSAKGIRTVLVVPLLLQGRLTGYCQLRSTRREEYGPRDLELAQALAHQVTLAIQMTHLTEQARQTAVLEERNRMAREIHDTLAQAFTGIVLQLSSAERLLAGDPARGQAHLQSIRDLAREGLAEARRSVQALRPQALEQMELADTLARMVQRLDSGGAPRIEFHLHGAPRRLRPDVTDHLLRIGQEALTNALRHARASTIRVELTFAEAEVRLVVQDDGQGLEAGSPERREGFGLKGMRERAGILAAELTVTSKQGRGTRVEVRWRMPQE
jgi:signal transduction histidine kinase